MVIYKNKYIFRNCRKTIDGHQWYCKIQGPRQQSQQDILVDANTNIPFDSAISCREVRFKIGKINKLL